MTSRLSYRFRSNKQHRFFYFEGASIDKAVFLNTVFEAHGLDPQDCALDMRVLGENQDRSVLYRNSRVLLYRVPLGDALGDLD